MATAKLELSTLHHLSEGLAQDFLQQIEAAVADCHQRPSLAKRREVTLKLSITPHPEDPDDVLIEPVTTRKMPARMLEPIRGRRGRGDQLHFDFLTDEDRVD